MKLSEIKQNPSNPRTIKDESFAKLVLNRRCYGCEIDPQYCQVIIDRMRKMEPGIEIKKNGEFI